MFLFFVAANCSFIALGNNLCIGVKKLFFHHCLCLLYMVLLLKLGLLMFLDLLLLLFAIKNNKIYIDHVKMIFFKVLVWFLFLVMDSSISPASADLSKVVDLATLYTLSHRLGIVWVHGLNENKCNSPSWAFCHVFVVF